MKKVFLPLAVLLGLGTGGCTDDSQPAIAPNTLALELNGVAFPVNVAASSLVVDPAGRTIVLTAKSRDGVTQIQFRGRSSNPRGLFAPQTFNPVSRGGASGEASATYLAAFNNYLTCFGRTLSGLQTYESTLCNHPDNVVITLQAADQTAHTMRGTFSGTCCKNAEPCDDKVVTNGRFNLTY